MFWHNFKLLKGKQKVRKEERVGRNQGRKKGRKEERETKLLKTTHPVCPVCAARPGYSLWAQIRQTGL